MNFGALHCKAFKRGAWRKDREPIKVGIISFSDLAEED
jgi:hypothetical protein